MLRSRQAEGVYNQRLQNLALTLDKPTTCVLITVNHKDHLLNAYTTLFDSPRGGYTNSDCYDPLDPNGNVTATFDILQWTVDGYVLFYIKNW
ncbi:unnamed protein product [Camellia sinensis]